MLFRQMSNFAFFNYSVLFCLSIFSSICFHSLAASEPQPLNEPIFYESAPGMFAIQSNYPDAQIELTGDLPSGLSFSIPEGFAIIRGTPAMGTEGTYPIILSFSDETIQRYTLTVFYEEPPSSTKGNIEMQKNMNFIDLKRLLELGCVGGGKNSIKEKGKHCIKDKTLTVLSWKSPKQARNKVPIIGFRIFSNSKLVAIVPNREEKQYKLRLPNKNFKDKQFSIVSVNGLGIFSKRVPFTRH